MGETLLVIAIVVSAALFAGRAFYRTLTGKDGKCSGCTDCHCGKPSNASSKHGVNR